MIKAIKTLIGLGRLTLPSPVILDRWTFVYGDNGSGKSSTARLLRSAAAGGPSQLLDFRTIDSTADVVAEIEVDFGKGSPVVTHALGTWSGPAGDIRVFDAEFVSTNLYTGPAVNPEHRSNLHRFVLGAANVALATTIDACDAETRRLNGLIEEAERGLKAYQGPVSLEDFLGLAADPSLDTKIAIAKERLGLAKKASSFAAQPLFRSPSHPAIDIAGHKRLLGTSLQDIAETSLASAEAHMAHLGAGGQPWLAQGLRYTGTSPAKCPFCGVDITDNELVRAYQLLFAKEYEAHHGAVTAALESLNQASLARSLAASRSAVEFNDGLAPAWQLDGVTPPNRLPFDTACQSLEKAAALLEQCLSTKRDTLHLALPQVERMSQAEAHLTEAASGFAAYQLAVRAANEDIASKKAVAATYQVQELERELDALNAHKTRHSTEGVAACDRLLVLRTARKKATEDKSTAKEALEKAIDSLTPDLVEKINAFLKSAGADFSVESLSTGYGGGTPKAEYGILLRKKKVPGTKKAGTPHHLGNVLSDGDRSALAFAFFLARLEADPTADDAVCVIDDPITSQDGHRRSVTRNRVIALGKKVRQLVLMSHDAHFLAECVRALWHLKGNGVQLLELVKHGTDSAFAPWRPQDAVASEYSTRYRVVSDYVHSGKGNERDVAIALRILLEGYLKRRFPAEFPSDQMVGPAINALAQLKRGGKPILQDPDLTLLKDLNTYASQFHHEDGSPNMTHPINSTGLRTHAELLTTLINR